MKERFEHNEECTEVAHRIQEDIDRLSQVQDQLLLIAMGLKKMHQNLKMKQFYNRPYLPKTYLPLMC